MKLNQFEVIDTIEYVSRLLDDIYDSLVEHNMGQGELNINSSPQLKQGLEKINSKLKKINYISN